MPNVSTVRGRDPAKVYEEIFFLNGTDRRASRYINREGAESKAAKYRIKLSKGLNYKVIKISRLLSPVRYQVLSSSLIFARSFRGTTTLLLKILVFRSFHISHRIKIKVVVVAFLGEPVAAATLVHQSEIFVLGDRGKAVGYQFLATPPCAMFRKLMFGWLLVSWEPMR